MALLLNHVRLAPGEAIWMPAGNLHAYLRGAGVEIMAASDNVLRGGLTPKRVDVAELLRVLRFEVLDEPVVPAGPGRRRAWSPGRCRCDDFALHRVQLDRRRPGRRWTAPGPRVVLCTAGRLTVRRRRRAGRARRGPGGDRPGGAGPVTLTGDGEAFVASLGA